jgi:tetratricopeptide (TPR) repeat protein
MNLTDQQISDFNTAYNNGCKKMKGIVILDGYRPNGIGFFKKLKAKKAIKYFEEALSIAPENFQCLFFLGKIYQRTSEYGKSLACFEMAMEYEKENHFIPLEASLVAMNLNLIEKAIEYSNEGLKRKPNDIALLGNQAMNLLIAGLDNDAKATIEKALEINASDEVNKNVNNIIVSVINGKSVRPTFKDVIS